LDVPPDLVFEVLSPSDRWSNVLAKIGEYLTAGVRVVCVLDPAAETAQTFYPDRPSRTLAENEAWTLPEVLGDFRVAVRQFLE
jgi:Uma2 family endonuclease